MKRTMVHLTWMLAVAAALGLIVWIGASHTEPVAGVVSPSALIADLAERLEHAKPGSPEARRILADIQRIRAKATKTRTTTENPGILMEAFAQLKTTRDGRTYAPNYKVRALRRTRQRAAFKTSGTLPWVERGPGNVSGRARAVIVDQSDATGTTWWAATIGGGMWKTDDAGATWTHMTPELTTLSTTTLVQAPSNPDVLYAGTGMGYGRVVDLEGSGIWKSTDHGETWFQLESTANGELLEAVNRLVVDPTDENVVLACTNDSFSHLGIEEGPRRSAIFRSTDGGATWTQVFDPGAVFGSTTDNRVQQIVADPTDFNTLYATVNEVGVIKSSDGGVTWAVSADDFALPSDIGNPTGGGFGLAGISVRTEMAVAPTDPGRLYAAVERPRGVADLYMSTDAGATWTLLPDTGNDPNWFNAFNASGATGAYTAGWFDNAIAVHPFDEDVVFVGGVNLFRIDVNPTARTRRAVQIAGGAGAQNLPYVHPDHHWLTFIADEATGTVNVLNANDGGVALSPDGGVNWQQFTGMGTTQFYGADKKPGEDAYLGGTQDNGTWISGANPDALSAWRHVIGADGFEVVWNYADPNLLLGGSQGNGLNRSADGGQTWVPIPEFPDIAGFSPFITKIANSKADPYLVFAHGSNGIIRSDDFGASWTVSPVQGNWLGWRSFDNVEVSNADPQVVWISSRMDVDPASGARGGIHVSTDGGLTFTEVSNNFPPALAEASGIATHPTDPNTAFMLFAGPGEPKVMKTTDLGQTWVDLSGFSGAAKSTIGESPTGFPDVAVFSLLVMPFDTDVLWAGTEIGLFESTDGGQTWSLANNGFPPVAIFEVSIVDDQVVVATQGRGVWSVTLPELAGYAPPVVTLAPRLHPPVMLPEGTAALNVDLRSAYDSTVVIVDGAVFARLEGNAARADTSLRYPVTEATTITASVTSYRDGRALRTAERSVAVFPAVAQVTYANTFDEPGGDADFAGTGFMVTQPAGFSTPAIHTPHPYNNATDLIYQLLVPIEVARGNAFLTFDEIALIEEGITDDWTHPNFFDFVVVEGTKDGTTWLPLVPGYDARADPQWLQAYRNGLPPGGLDSQTPGDPSMFVTRHVDLFDTFQPGDLIFVRFRLHADPLARAWGWAIDNVDIQPDAIVASEDVPEMPSAFRLGPNYPNPFNPTTMIPFTLDAAGDVSLAVYDVTGRKVRTLLVHDTRGAGHQAVRFDASGLASGTYLYRLEVRAEGDVQPRRAVRVMTVVR